MFFYGWQLTVYCLIQKHLCSTFTSHGATARIIVWFLYTPKQEWKCVGTSAPGCNGHFDISVSSFTMIHCGMWQTYSRNENRFFFLSLFESVIYILANIPTRLFSREMHHLHTQCTFSLMSAHLKDLRSGPAFELQLKVNIRKVWLNILFMHKRISLTVSAAALSKLHL